jgi:ribosomal protein S18 acetylase RimI-like enzyme
MPTPDNSATLHDLKPDKTGPDKTGPDDLTIRRATADDVPALVAFNQAMAQETEGKGLDAEVLTSGVMAVLEDVQKGFYLVAEHTGDEDDAVASLLITREWSDWRDGVFWWIQSVYVRPAWRRRGVFRALYAEVERRARAQGDVCGLRLYVERDNDIARRTYDALGMDETPYRLYEADWST